MRGEEILSLRTENGKDFQTGPQKYRSVTYLDAIHYKDEKSGEYRLIDNRLEQDGESLHNKGNPSLRVELTPEGISLRNAKGAGLSWCLEGAKPCPPKAVEQEAKEELDQIRSAAVYEEILPGADLRCEINGVHGGDAPGSALQLHQGPGHAALHQTTTWPTSTACTCTRSGSGSPLPMTARATC